MNLEHRSGGHGDRPRRERSRPRPVSIKSAARLMTPEEERRYDRVLRLFLSDFVRPFLHAEEKKT
jgi:hypothetical protein